MSEINEQCVYLCGPYRGYSGKAEYDRSADSFHGEVIGVRDVVTFEGSSPGELKRAFKESVDDYLDFCRSRGESPEKPFSGKFVTRIDPQLHRELSALADRAGKSLNQLVGDCLTQVAQSAALESSASTKGGKQPPNGSRPSHTRGKRRRA